MRSIRTTQKTLGKHIKILWWVGLYLEARKPSMVKWNFSITMLFLCSCITFEEIKPFFYLVTDTKNTFDVVYNKLGDAPKGLWLSFCCVDHHFLEIHFFVKLRWKSFSSSLRVNKFKFESDVALTWNNVLGSLG